MSNLKRGSHLRVFWQKARERRRAMKRPARHVLNHFLQQLHVGIDHPVAITFTSRCTIVDLAGIDQVKIAGASLLSGAIDRRYLRAGFDGANAEGLMRVRRIFMRQESRAQAFHIPEPPVAPETCGFRRGKRHIVEGLFLRNAVHSERIKQSVITVLNKSDRLWRK